MEKQHKSTSELPQGLTFTQKIGMVAGSVSALYLLPTGADAAIVYHNTPLTISNSSTVGFDNGISWDVDGNNVEEFRLWKNIAFTTIDNTNRTFLNLFNNSSAFFVFLSAPAPSSRYFAYQIEKLSQSFQVGQTLAANYAFGDQSSFRSIAFEFSNLPGAGIPNFSSGQDGYIGFKFNIGPDTHYGWATLNYTWNSETDFSYTIKEWAYNSCANDSIHIADTTGVGPCDVSTPEPSSNLALLAMGAAGVYRWRKRRKFVKNNEEDRAA